MCGNFQRRGRQEKGSKEQRRGNEEQIFIAWVQNNLAVLCRGQLAIITKIHVKQHPDDSQNLGFLVLNYQMQQDMYLALLSQTKDRHEHTLEKL